jgi:hypothetical protein
MIPTDTISAPVAKLMRKRPDSRITPQQAARVRFYIGAGYSVRRASEITMTPIWYCELIKAQA